MLGTSDKLGSGNMPGVSDMHGVGDTGVVINMPCMSDMSGLIYDHGHYDVGDVSEMLRMCNVNISRAIRLVSDKPGKNDMRGLMTCLD
jgi:hypothetical protein